MDRQYDVVIIGSGPAGLSAAIYAQRAELDAIVIEKSMASGGQVLNTYEVDNYPGLPGIGGYELGMKLREHADKLGGVFVTDDVRGLETGEGIHTVVCENGRYEAKTVIIATGASHRKLGAPGEERLSGSGVSYCATCDGAFFKKKTTAVIGGGDVAIEDAIFLARMCEKVYLIHRRDELRGAKSLQNKLFSLPNVEALWNTVADEIEGGQQVEALALSNVKTGEKSRIPVQGVFVAVGISPNSDPFQGVVEMENGYIKAGEECAASVPGIFAAGDVRTKQLRQIVTAVSDGANAITAVERYLASR